LKLVVTAALAAAFCVASATFAPASAETASGENQVLRGTDVKPNVKSRFGATVKSRRVVSKATRKPVAVSSRFSGKARASKPRSSRTTARSRSTKTALKGGASRYSARALRSGQWVGTASYYRHGRKTANGEHFNPMGLTAAHRTLPFGTRVRVTHVGTGKSVVVRINDRGPFVHSRIIDLAMGAAQAIGVDGVARVALQVLP